MNMIRWLVTGLLGAWVLLWRGLGDRWGWLGMINAWGEWGRAALGGLALLGALRGRWKQGGAALALWAIAARRAAGDPLLPWLPAFRTLQDEGALQPETEAVQQRFTLLGANLYKHNPGMEPHIALIREHRPDIVCLQEFQPTFARDLIAAVGDDYPFRAFRPEKEAYGFGVMARFPVEETGFWERPGVRPWAQRVRCTLPSGQAIEFYNVHLVPPAAPSTFEMGMTQGFRAREAQLRAMQREIAARGVPACIIGDHNFTDCSDAYRIALETWSDAWRVAGRGPRWTWPMRHFPFGWPPRQPRMLRLDYCFYTPTLRALHARVLTARTGSDHCPLLVTLAVT